MFQKETTICKTSYCAFCKNKLFTGLPIRHTGEILRGCVNYRWVTDDDGISFCENYCGASIPELVKVMASTYCPKDLEGYAKIVSGFLAGDEFLEKYLVVVRLGKTKIDFIITDGGFFFPEEFVKSVVSRRKWLGQNLTSDVAVFRRDKYYPGFTYLKDLSENLIKQIMEE